MNLNKWLCKTFDTDKKGYVTVSDIMRKVIEYAMRCFIILLVIGILYHGIVFIITIEQKSSNGYQEPDIFGFLGFAAWIAIAVFGSWYLWDTKISQIKISKCPLKENENK